MFQRRVSPAPLAVVWQHRPVGCQGVPPPPRLFRPQWVTAWPVLQSSGPSGVTTQLLTGDYPMSDKYSRWTFDTMFDVEPTEILRDLT
jgi:hypothetical protein